MLLEWCFVNAIIRDKRKPCAVFVVENNVPYIVSPAMHQWQVLQANSVNISIIDPDNDTVDIFPLTSLPRGSSLSQLTGFNTWQFVWTPINMDPVDLVSV